MSEPPSHHLAWLALQYICDELADDDRQAFEQRLADDQAAREAVAEAVEQCAAIRMAYCNWPGESPTNRPELAAAIEAGRGLPPSRLKRRAMFAAAWMVAAAAASLAALMLLPGNAERPQDPSAAGGLNGDAHALARAYIASESIQAHWATWAWPAEGSRDLEWGALELAPHIGGSNAEDAARLGSDDEAFLARDDVTIADTIDAVDWDSMPVDPLIPKADDWMLALVAVGDSAANAEGSDNEP